jgi:hypothetical protein
MIPLARHFLTHVQAARHSVTDKQEELDQTCQACLGQPCCPVDGAPLGRAKAGISMNLVATRRPSRTGWSDLCPSGLEGFLLRSGWVWRMRIPTGSTLCGSALINDLPPSPFEWRSMSGWSASKQTTRIAPSLLKTTPWLQVGCAKGQWLGALCAKPQATCLQCLGTISDQVPRTSLGLFLRHSCSLAPTSPASKPLPMPTQAPNDNAPSLPSCCKECTP